MKRLNFPPMAVFAITLFLPGGIGFAQIPGAGDAAMPGTDLVTLSKLFGENTSFTARSDIHKYDKDQKETTRVVMDISHLDNKVRLEIDATQMKDKNLPAGAAESLKQLGMERAVSLIRPDKLSIYLLYPRFESYLTVPLPKEDIEAGAGARIEKEEIGKETFEGHPCIKNKVTITLKGDAQELTVWNATDLRGFPVQIIAKQNQDTIVTHYEQVKFDPPAATQFDPPASFQEYDSQQAFMLGIMSKLMKGALQP